MGSEMCIRDSNRGPLILALAMGILIVFGAVVWNTYRQGVRTSGDDLPVIAAVPTPYKQVPADHGGAETPDLDARIYDQIDGATRPIAPKANSDAATQAEQQPGLPTDLLGGRPVGDQNESAPIVLGQVRKLESIRGDVDPQNGAQVASVSPTVPSAPIPSVEELIAPPTSPVKAELSRFDFTGDGQFLVQISALRSNAAAERAWSDANKKSPDLFKGSEKHIQRADLGAKGVFYRLRVGSFSERGAASEFCDALKSAKHQCIVVQN